MNRLPTLFLGFFLTFLSAWLGLILIPTFQIGALKPEVTEDGGYSPPSPAGSAIAGESVYAANGCVLCHTQQVRNKIDTADGQYGWGRQTVARDYIAQRRVFLGTMRTGPDLASTGASKSDPAWHHLHLYNPQHFATGSLMPSFRYLYKTQKILGQRAANALDVARLPEADRPPAGYEIVPTRDAQDLVAYLISLNRSYSLKEVKE
ncbi:MAG: cbb3-type cytochrome c oxidase subunit II [Candidatus Methylacidiphilales bacterium]|nr:cbb3-type cytochrome c oxidase subunit II [Candidatus Methylacidiphilales bacterium]